MPLTQSTILPPGPQVTVLFRYWGLGGCADTDDTKLSIGYEGMKAQSLSSIRGAHVR